MSGQLAPGMQVPNCYFDDTVCADDEWCMLDDHIKWGKQAPLCKPLRKCHWIRQGSAVILTT